MRDKAQHHARRKMQSSQYSQQSILANEAHIAEETDVLVRRIVDAAQKSETGTVDVYNFCALFSLEVILKVSFDRDCVDSEQEEPQNSLSQTLLDAMDATALLLPGALPFLRPLCTAGIGRYLPGIVGKASRQFDVWVELTHTILRDFAQKEKNLNRDQRFLATPFFTNTDEFLGRSMTEEEAVEEAMGLMFAGSRTTSTTLAYLIYCLASAEDIQSQLREELQALGEDPTISNVKDLPLLNAVIKETMRLHPTIFSTLPRVLDSPICIGDFVLPKDTEIGMQNYVHHRDPKVFPQPDEFLPNRWLHNNSNGEMNDAFTPFSLGPRNCIGQNLARVELLLATSRIFRNLKIKLADTKSSEDDMEMKDVFIILPKGQKLLVKVEVVV